MYYVEFEDELDSSVRYVLGDFCQYHGYAIDSCTCGICDELRRSTNMKQMVYNPDDEFHYVWCGSWDLRPPFIVNSERNFVVPGLHTSIDMTIPEDESVVEASGLIVYDMRNVTEDLVAETNVGEAPTPEGDRDTISDSGATRHMFNNRKHFSTYRTATNHHVRVANGKMIPVLGIGKVGPLNEVLHVPSLVYNLMSEPALDKEGKWIIAGNGIRTFYNRTAGGQADLASVFIVANLTERNLYIVNPMYLGLNNKKYNYKSFEALASKSEAIDLLHKTLGHISVDRLQDAVKTGHMEWTHETPPVNLRKYSSPCVACSLAKSKRQSHTRKIKVPLEPGSLVYVDVWGPCETSSLINENNYTIGFIDAATKRA